MNWIRRALVRRRYWRDVERMGDKLERQMMERLRPHFREWMLAAALNDPTSLDSDA